MTTSYKVMFRGHECRLQFDQYVNGRIGIELYAESGRVARATVNVPCFPLGEHEVLIKGYAENAGMLEALAAAGIVRPTGVRCRVGPVEADVCELLMEPPSLQDLH